MLWAVEGSCRVGSSTLRKTDTSGAEYGLPSMGLSQGRGRDALRGTEGSKWVRESEPRRVSGPASLGVLAFLPF